MESFVDQNRDEQVAIELKGSVDFCTVPELRKRLIKMLKKGMRRNVRLNFSQVTHMDTSGAAMLIELSRIASMKEGRLLLDGMNDQVRRMIRLARLEQIFALDGEPGMEGGSQ